jgi:coenzyme Q-binding protein COQ10
MRAAEARMVQFSTTHRVAFTPRQMFDLVADVAAYPKFLPLCEALTVRKRERAGDKEILIADMTVGYRGIKETFTSRVVLDPAALAVHAAAAAEHPSGPFRTLANDWRFVAAPGGCDVTFHIAYEFKSRMLAVLVGSLFDRVFRRYARAFEERARVVYGDGAPHSG